MGIKRKSNTALGTIIFILIILIAIGVVFFTDIIDFTPILSKVVTVQVSVLILAVFAMINFLLIINFLYTTYTSSTKALAIIEKEKQIDQAKNEFITLISHQLRTPLSAINWQTEALESGDLGDMNEKQKSYLAGIYASSQRMTALINSIIDVSRIELHAFVIYAKPTKIFPLIEDVVHSFSEQITIKKLSFHKDYTANLCTIRIDERYVRMILDHLIANAIKYTPNKGDIHLEAVCRDHNLYLTITDTGYGIPEQEISRVFSKLFRASNILTKDTEGAGISLYIVKTIIDYAGGKISVTSKQDHGTTFSVMLPARIE